MDSFIGLIFVVAIVACIIVYRKTLARSGEHTEYVATAYLAEAKIPVIKRMQQVKKQIDTLGEIVTPEEMYKQLTHPEKKD